MSDPVCGKRGLGICPLPADHADVYHETDYLYRGLNGRAGVITWEDPTERHPCDCGHDPDNRLGIMVAGHQPDCAFLRWERRPEARIHHPLPWEETNA